MISDQSGRIQQMSVEERHRWHWIPFYKNAKGKISIDTPQRNLQLTQFELDCPGNGLDHPTHHPTHETLPAQLASDMCVQLYSHTQTSAATLYYNRLSLILAR